MCRSIAGVSLHCLVIASHIDAKDTCEDLDANIEVFRSQLADAREQMAQVRAGEQWLFAIAFATALGARSRVDCEPSHRLFVVFSRPIWHTHTGGKAKPCIGS